MYLAYPDYLSYGGTLDETAFINYEIYACAKVDYRTFGRLRKYRTAPPEEIPEELKRCIYAIIELVKLRADALSPGSGGNSNAEAGVRSQSNDGVSVTYNAMDAESLFESCNKEIDNTINIYLDCLMDELGRRILYRGLYPGE